MTNSTERYAAFQAKHAAPEEMMDHIRQTSGEMYDAWFDFLATYQFGFGKATKEEILSLITEDIRDANNDPELEDSDD